MDPLSNPPIHTATETVAADIYCVARAHIDIRDSVALVAAALNKTMDEAIALLGFNHWDERLKCESPTDIVFNHVRPPIPSRSYDWSALRRSQQYDESPTTGCGSTPLLAAIDLLEQEQSPAARAHHAIRAQPDVDR